MNKKLFIVLFLSLFFFLYLYFDLSHLLSFESIKEKQSQMENYNFLNPIKTSLMFFIFYVVITAVSLPGAAILSLLAGALFGLIHGTIIISLASSLGASLAFLTSRYLFQKNITTRFKPQLESINRGIIKEGGFYLFSLRLIPIFPFFLINLVMGVTSIKLSSYFFISWIGMLPGTLLYINAGTQLADLESINGILSPSILLSFFLIGLFPLIAKKTMACLKTSQK